MKVTKTFGYDAMSRHISEGVRINKVPKERLINTSTEWNYANIPRAMIS